MTPTLAVFAAALTLALTPLVRRLAIRRNWVAQPVKDRWHSRPTALMGGLAIFGGFALPLLFLADFSSLLLPLEAGVEQRPLPDPDAVVWLGAALLFVLGLVDDFIRIKPQSKLLGQILVASLVTFLGFRLHWFDSLTLDTVTTIVWIVGVTNAFNLIDNMDGLCAGVAMIASLYLGLMLSAGAAAGMAAPFLLAGALAGFLVFNFNPASIFMGDCGSLPIGFVLATSGLVFAGGAAETRLAAYAVPVMVLMVPLLDTSLVTLIRLLSGRSAAMGGRDHTSHRLVLMGLSERDAVLLLYGVGAISGVAALFVGSHDSITSPAAMVPLAVSVLLMAVYLAQIRVYPEGDFCMLRGKAYTPILLELTYKRQILLVLLDFGLVAFSYYLSYRLRFGGDDLYFYFQLFLHSLPAIISCKLLAFFIMGVYRGIWRYMSSNDVYVYLKASTLATLLSITAVTFLYRFQDFSKGIFLIDWLITTALLLGTRGSFRIAQDALSRRRMAGERVVIYGAGRGGEILLRELLHNNRHQVRPVGFVDDDVLKTGKKLLGYPILGTFQEMDRLRERHGVQGVLVSFNGSAPPERVEALRQYCREKGLDLKKFAIHLEAVELERKN